ncbi:T9SS type B sorting domain-containing protein [Flavobacterium urocaniciphilum]|nr:T9SS type B sorting domain-containing protein [Flavobacterium urocaniciphilum]
MLKNILLFITFLFSQFSLGQDFQWVRQFEGSYFSNENESAIEVDNSGNNYTFGIIFEELFDLDPTSGTQIIDNTSQSTSPKCSLFLTKLDTDGNFIWGKTFGSIFGFGDKVIDIEIGTDGNIYLLADIREQTTFIQKFITIFKIDPLGNILMTKKITNLANPNPYDTYSSSSLALDNQNNIFITGSFKDDLKIDPTNPQLYFNTGSDSFLLKINTLGNIVWGRKFNMYFLNSHYESVKIDNNQNPIVIVSNEENQSYNNFGYNIFKINSNDGTTVWQKILDKQNPSTFNIDHLNNIIIAGNGKDPYGSDIDVDPSSNTFLINPTRYLLWLTNNGDFLDVKKYPAVNPFNYFAFTKIEFDNNNNTYLVGQFNSVFDADPTINYYPLSYSCGNPNTRDAFYIKFNNNRDFVSAFKLGDHNNNCINFYFTDFKIKNDNQYYVGNFSPTADFDPTIGTYILSTSGIFGSRFTLKLGPCDSTTPSTANNQTFCSAENPTVSSLTPNSNDYNWYLNLNSTTELNNSTPLINGHAYYVSKQKGNCPESSRIPVIVTINPSPNALILNNQTFCENENADLNDIVITGQNIKWYISNTATTVLPNNTLLQNNTTYYASQTVNGCESTKTPILITIIPNTLPTLISPQTFCIQYNSTINDIVITGQNIKWYDAATNGNLLPNTTALVNGTTYYASQTINGCESNRVPVLIQIQNTPVPTGNANQSFCITQNATVADIITNGINLIWYNSATGTTPLPSTTLLTNNSIYYATQSINGCVSQNRLVVSISIINTLNATNYSEILCDNLNNNSEIINLSSYNTNLIASSGNTFSYYDSYNNALSQNSAGQIINFSNYNLTIGTNTFYVRIDSPNTCFQIVTLTLELVSKPNIPINDIAPICEGSFITLNGGNNYDTYTWSTGETSQQITVTQPGNYSVVVTENHGTTTCTSTKNFSVVNSNVATIQEIISADWTDNNNTITVQLNSNSQGDYEYSLNGIDFQNSNNFDNLDPGEYTVYVRDKNGCGMVSEEIYLLMYPKFFTPNGDGYNDYWKIKFSENEPNLTIKIFDRYGKFIKQLGSNSIGWDGTYLGKDLPSSDYWFVVIRENGKEYKGHFSLKR